MTPDKNLVTSGDNVVNIIKFINEVVIYQKQTLSRWSLLTMQSPAAKIGYIGQHLASLITGVEGTRSGARGDDLADGTEVKSCNKIDQADKCKSCGARVMRNQNSCPICGSTKIDRKDDSKWLFSIRDEQELQQYLNLDRLLLILMDYPGFDNSDFSSIRISTFEIYPKEERMSVFCDLIRNHYYNIYRKKADVGQKTNPMNLHPFSIQFYKCNPIKTFELVIKDIDSEPQFFLTAYIEPLEERNAQTPSLDMPTTLLNKEEWNILLEKANYKAEIVPLLTEKISKKEFVKLSKKKKEETLPMLNEQLKAYIPLRKITSTTQKQHYQRKKTQSKD